MPHSLPVFYIPHGGGPWPFVDLGIDPAEHAALYRYLSELAATLPHKPQGLLLISAHWERAHPTLMTAEYPPLFYDYYGFPPASYEIQWPAPGAPELANRVAELLTASGFQVGEDAQRGFDHGTFIPMKLSFPEAEIPTTQLSLIKGLDPSEHLRLGEALRPLREEGVLIVGSGMSFHDLRAFFHPQGASLSKIFDQWLQQVATAEPDQRNEALKHWYQAPSARQAHPREEHLLPLMVAAGAAGEDRGELDFRGTYGGTHISAFRFAHAA